MSISIDRLETEVADAITSKELSVGSISNKNLGEFAEEQHDSEDAEQAPRRPVMNQFMETARRTASKVAALPFWKARPKYQTLDSTPVCYDEEDEEDEESLSGDFIENSNHQLK